METITVHRVRRSTHRFVAALLLTAPGACTRTDPSPFWRAGGTYTLTLVATSSRPARSTLVAPGPTADTARLRLRVDSLAGDVVYGHVDGDTRNVQLPFRAIGGGRFTAARQRERWRVSVNPDVTDSGLELDGELSHGQLRGRWRPRFMSPTRGTFALAPAT